MKDFKVEDEGKLAVKNDKLVYIGIETKQKLGQEITESDKAEYRKAFEMNLLPDNDLLDDSILEEYQPFITEWTVETGDSITLPIENYIHNRYNFTVDYGDGTGIKTVDSYTDEDKMHTYEKAGVYRVTIKGQCPAFNFNGEYSAVIDSREKITRIVQWGNIFKNDGGLAIEIDVSFSGCTNLKGPIPSPIKNTFAKIKWIKNLFSNCTSLTGEIPENLFYNCNLNDYSNIFYGCVDITKIPKDLFKNCTEATTFQSAFGGCKSITEIPDGLFSNCSNVISFSGTFARCASITEVPNDLFVNCNKATSFDATFVDCENLVKVGNNIFKSNLGMNFYRLFENCTSLENVPDELFLNCTGENNSYQRTFLNCKKLTKLPQMP